MGIELGRALRRAREDLGKTQADVGGAVKVSRAAVGQWEAGDTEPSTENLIAACEYLGIDLAEAIAGRVRKLSAPPQPSGRIQVAPPRVLREQPLTVPTTPEPQPLLRLDMPKDVPVLGIAVGGSDADFVFNGSVIDYARRPPGIAHTKDVYALYISGSSMSPRFEEGELVYVAPSRTPSVGDYVVVQTVAEREGDDNRALIKRLTRRTADALLLEQFNPPETIRIPSHDVASVHRVIPWHEVLGI